MRGLSVIREVLWKNQRRGHNITEDGIFFRENLFISLTEHDRERELEDGRGEIE